MKTTWFESGVCVQRDCAPSSGVHSAVRCWYNNFLLGILYFRMYRIRTRSFSFRYLPLEMYVEPVGIVSHNEEGDQ